MVFYLSFQQTLNKTMKRITLLALVLTILFSVTQAQRRGKPSTSLVVSVGTNHFMGDLGGGAGDAAHFFGVRDIDFNATRPTWQVAYRYKFAAKKYEVLKYFSVRANFSYAFLSGKDKSAGHVGRQSRNLSFINNVYSLSGQIEYYFIPEKARPRHAFKSLSKSRNISAYMFLGFGGFYHAPMARLEGEKFEYLRALGTEGQLEPGFEYESKVPTGENGTEFETYVTPKPYSRIAMLIAVGFGVKYDINRKWAVGLEMSNRYTSSDYMDDAHDKYFNYDDFSSLSATQSEFADRHLTYTEDAVGETDPNKYLSGKTMRGNPDYNDAYILTMITVHYKLSSSRRRSGPKFKSSW